MKISCTCPRLLCEVQVRAVGGGDAGGFLAAMLQRVKAEIGEFGGFRVAKYAENAAVIVEVIVVETVNFGNHALSSALPSDSLQILLKRSRRSASITGAPLYWMRNSPRVTVPIRMALDTILCRNSVTRASEAGESDTTARAPRSPKSAASAGNSARLLPRSIEVNVGRQVRR